MKMTHSRNKRYWNQLSQYNHYFLNITKQVSISLNTKQSKVELDDIYNQVHKEVQQTNSSSSSKFWCGNDTATEGCCFNHRIGLPIKNGKEFPIFKYETDIVELLKKEKKIWIKKSTGLGISEIFLRIICWKAETDPTFKDSIVCVVTSPRLELATTLIQRIRRWYPDAEYKQTRIIINGVIIEAFPSHHLDAMRGLANPKLILLDEADFFPASIQREVLTIAERYIAKSNPHIVLVSTPNMPDGLYSKIEKDTNSIYHKLMLDYTVGLEAGLFTEEEITEAKKSPSFEREYNLKYGSDDGNIFSYDLISKITLEYDLALHNGDKILAIDPAYSSSKFAIVGAEKQDDVIQIKLCELIEFASPTEMANRIALLSKEYPVVYVDSAGAGLITDLELKGVDTKKVVFAKELNEMTLLASRLVREMKVQIHPAFNDLLADLKSVRYNEKGHPDKKLINFDLGDAFLMLCHAYGKVKQVSSGLLPD